MTWKYLSLSLLFFLFFLAPIFSDVNLTDEEYNSLMKALDNSENKLTEQESRIKDLEMELEGLKNEQQISERVITMQSTELEMLRKSSSELKNDQKAEYWRGFRDGTALGFGIGFPIGGYAGFSIGMKISF